MTVALFEIPAESASATLLIEAVMLTFDGILLVTRTLVALMDTGILSTAPPTSFAVPEA